MVVAQMLERGVGIHFGETAVHHADAKAFAVDAFVDEMLASEAFELVSEVVLGVVVIASAARQSGILKKNHFF